MNENEQDELAHERELEVSGARALDTCELAAQDSLLFLLYPLVRAVAALLDERIQSRDELRDSRAGIAPLLVLSKEAFDKALTH